MKKICKNCRYFLNASEDVDANMCNCPKFKYGYNNVSDYYIEKDIVLVEESKGWGFFPGENFGCIHFKEKKEHAIYNDMKKDFTSKKLNENIKRISLINRKRY